MEVERDAALGEARVQTERAVCSEENVATLTAKLEALDIFKLDVIARELKKVDGSLRQTKAEVAMLQRAVKLIHSPAEREASTQQLTQAVGAIGWSRGRVRDVIQQCLTELQKYHIGADHVGLLAGGEDLLHANPHVAPKNRADHAEAALSVEGSG
eukprot:CAMPEP_0119354382 /NCGR_PEP_ID=MMETSP1334-20130426/3384_1 /TAXON_ID=127549 /ORGANISM="Calcidiscus leptoporus, Strain RCC1130" /LENGTH=155 /DNA_ID=CAMNT_0007367911 /DNA_START=1 /DNA_END=468 /DNA_ORIENTATION=-